MICDRCHKPTLLVYEGKRTTSATCENCGEAVYFDPEPRVWIDMEFYRWMTMQAYSGANHELG